MFCHWFRGLSHCPYCYKIGSVSETVKALSWLIHELVTEELHQAKRYRAFHWSPHVKYVQGHLPNNWWNFTHRAGLISLACAKDVCHLKSRNLLNFTGKATPVTSGIFLIMHASLKSSQIYKNVGMHKYCFKLDWSLALIHGTKL